MKRWSTVLLSLVLVGELLALGVRGTMASYTSQVNNPANSSTSGTLVLSTKAGSQSICQSWTASNNDNASCGSLAITGGPFWPGGSATVTMTVKNAGTLPGTLELFSNLPSSFPIYGCDDANNGNGICQAVEFYVQETTSGGTVCYYPEQQNSACSFKNWTTAGGVGTLYDFAFNNYYDTSDTMDLGTTAAVTTRTFTLGFELPRFLSPNATVDSYIGQTATFDLDWYISQ